MEPELLAAIRTNVPRSKHENVPENIPYSRIVMNKTTTLAELIINTDGPLI